MAPSHVSDREQGDDQLGSALAHHSDSASSFGVHFQNVQFSHDGDDSSSRLLDDDDDAVADADDDEQPDPYDNGSHRPRRRRRSSMGTRLAALTDLGGLNSIRSFTRSWQRAAGFTEVLPQAPSFVFAADQEPIFGAPNAASYGGSSFGDEEEAAGSLPALYIPSHLSVLRQQQRQSNNIADADSTAVTSSDDNTSLAAVASESAAGGGSVVVGIPDEAGRNDELKSLLQASGGLGRAFRAGSVTSIFGSPPHLASAAVSAAMSAGSGSGSGSGGVGGAGYLGTSPGMSSYRSYRSAAMYGSVGSAAGLAYGAMSGIRRPSGSMSQAGALWRQQQQQQQQEGVEEEQGHEQGQQGQPEMAVVGDERPAILVKEVEEDGKIILTVEGQSTLPQTIFNSINVLIGVGLLSLPMGIRYAGWICGMATLAGAAWVTSYTARLLAKCMDLDPVVITFSDLAYISFGPRARLMTSLLFTLELLAACVALVVLFADSLGLLFPDMLSPLEWKALCCFVMVPLNFLPMRLLSVTSIIGIVCCFSIVSIVVIDGLTKATAPGSLLQPAATYMFPENWLTLPLSFGLLMSPWGGHSVFPNIYRDMRHPVKYAKAVKVTFSFTYVLDAVTAVVGILMFGDDVMDEITSNILTTSGYPRVLTLLLCVLIAIIPLTKIPLNARPIITMLEVLTGLQQPALSDSWLFGRTLAKVAIRVLTILSFFIISVLFPAFDSIMAFMGSALCFTICVTLPILFHLKLFGNSLSRRDKLLQYSLLTASLVTSIVGTVWSFLPKSLLGIVE